MIGFGVCPAGAMDEYGRRACAGRLEARVAGARGIGRSGAQVLGDIEGCETGDW